MSNLDPRMFPGVVAASAQPVAFHVLSVEDHVPDTELITRELRKSGFDPDVTRVESETEYLAALARKPDVILSDYNLPNFSGLLALELRNEHCADIPFVVRFGFDIGRLRKPVRSGLFVLVIVDHFDVSHFFDDFDFIDDFNQVENLVDNLDLDINDFSFDDFSFDDFSFDDFSFVQ